MKRFSQISKTVAVLGVAIFLAAASTSASAQRQESVYKGHKIIIPESSIPHAGATSHKLFLRRLRCSEGWRSALWRRNTWIGRLRLPIGNRTNRLPRRH